MKTSIFLKLSLFGFLILPNDNLASSKKNIIKTSGKLGACVLVTGSVLYLGWAYTYINFYRNAINFAPAISIDLLPQEYAYTPVLFVGPNRLNLEQGLAEKCKRYTQIAANNSWAGMLKNIFKHLDI